MSAIDVLREIEWGGEDNVCPSCRVPRYTRHGAHRRHASDCALDAALREPEPIEVAKANGAGDAYFDAATMALAARAPGMRDLRLERLAQALFDKGERARCAPPTTPVQQTPAPSSATGER